MAKLAEEKLKKAKEMGLDAFAIKNSIWLNLICDNCSINFERKFSDFKPNLKRANKFCSIACDREFKFKKNMKLATLEGFNPIAKNGKVLCVLKCECGLEKQMPLSKARSYNDYKCKSCWNKRSSSPSRIPKIKKKTFKNSYTREGIIPEYKLKTRSTSKNIPLDEYFTILNEKKVPQNEDSLILE